MFLRLLHMICIYKHIKHIYLPVCKNCKFFIPYESNMQNKLELSKFSKCKLFGEKNLITGEVSYEYAELCRKDENKCGINGKYSDYSKNDKK